MLTPELSLTILKVAIAIILVFYVTLLVKLKPSREIKPPLNRYIETVRTPTVEQKRPEKPTTPVETKKTTNEEPALTGLPKKVPEEPTENIQTEAHAETEENQKKETEKQAKKAFFLFGEREFEGCPHRFKYLRALPKNSPIPDECFGCPKILECLGSSKNKKR
jgi:type IV secretory pathway VirB10-like protein